MPIFLQGNDSELWKLYKYLDRLTRISSVREPNPQKGDYIDPYFYKIFLDLNHPEDIP